jgi:Fimbrial assembly protein (PilN)
MRELEFLPDWYPTLRRKRRTLMLEAWLGVAIAVVLGLWVAVSTRNVVAAQSVLNTRQGQIKQIGYELQKLSELESLKKQMSEQARLVASLGPNVPVSRILEDLEDKMPAEMALLDVSVDVRQQSRLRPGVRNAAVAAKAEPIVDRQMTIQLHGVAPSDVELGNYMIRLATIPCFTGSSLSTSDLRQNGRLMREFRISFTLSLTDSGN